MKKKRKPPELEADLESVRVLGRLARGAAKALEQMETDLARRGAPTISRTLRKANRWIFDVTGRGTFPFDMLRHDTCWPRTKLDVQSMTASKARGRRSVMVVSTRLPDEARWRQFNWTVGRVRPWKVQERGNVVP